MHEYQQSPPSPEDNQLQSLRDFSLTPFTEVIPHFWRAEILEYPSESPLKQPVMYAVMQGFGSLAALLYTRLIRLCKEAREEHNHRQAPLLRDLRQVYSITLCTMKALSKRRQAVCGQTGAQEGDDLLLTDDRKYVELGFINIILDFFNYHMSMAKREISSLMRVRWLLLNLLPTLKEMRTSLQDYYVHEDVSGITPFYPIIIGFDRLQAGT